MTPERKGEGMAKTDIELMTEHVESGIEEANCFCALAREAVATGNGDIPSWQQTRLDNIIDFMTRRRKRLHDIKRAQKKSTSADRDKQLAEEAVKVAGEINDLIDEGLDALTSDQVPEGNLIDHLKKKQQKDPLAEALARNPGNPVKCTGEDSCPVCADMKQCQTK